MNKLHRSAVLLVVLQNLSRGNNIHVEPTILTSSTRLQLPRGETALFECRVQNLGDRHIVWRRGYDVLATERMVLSPDPRISVNVDRDLFTLAIQDIGNQDKGEYVCQISTISGSSNLISVEHSLDILVAARVESVPESAYLTLQESEDAVLECKVTGNPAPTVTWEKQGSSKILLGTGCAEGSCVIIKHVHRSDSGVYICTADNGVGPPHSANIFLTVQYKPQIKIENKQKPLDQGRAKLECEVFGEPRPTVSWYRDSTKLQPSSYVKFQESGNMHILVLSDPTTSSFGNYSCVAKNLLGDTREFIEVHGRPSSLMFSTDESKPMRNFYVLSWEVISPTPILEYRLLYRQINKFGTADRYEGTDWTNVIIPGPEFQENYSKKRMSWNLEKLERGADYECLIQARNVQGWSLPSTMFTFNTAVKTFPSAATQGLSWSLEKTNGDRKLVAGASCVLSVLMHYVLSQLLHLSLVSSRSCK